MSIHQPLWYLPTPCLLPHQLITICTPAITEEKHDDTEPADGDTQMKHDDTEPADGDTQMKYSSDQLYTSKIGALTKNDMYELRSV